ncbi:pickpocket protein 28-like [Eurosta solidaginis]|uniref:pickpocket protein 28-like n=1 Tax=Eurosta solidaginis TaxID=178769 RepID=UPI0035314A04
MVVRERKSSVPGLYKKLKRLKDAYRENTTEFLRNSTIHGLCYFNKPELNTLERLFFMITFIVALIVSTHFILKVTEKWAYSPTIASLNPKPEFITDEPFPSLSICNMNQALKSKVANFSVYSEDYAILQTICNRKVNITVIESIKDWATIKDYIQKVSQPCQRMLIDCNFGGLKYNCSHIFRAVVMSEGVCCIFNSLDPKFNFVDGNAGLSNEIQYPPDHKPVDWTLENGYQNPLPKYFTPMKAVGKGQSLGLRIVLNVESDEYYCSSSNSVGFKIAMHNPNERPDIFEKGLLISPGYESFVRILPTKMDADDKLRILKPKSRNCIFLNEYNLKTFVHYSYDNCMYECRTAMALHYCGCIAAYMAPRSPNSSVCHYENWKCLEDIKLAAKVNEFGCTQRCWHSCISKTYRMDVFAAPLENGAMENMRTLIGNASIDYVKRNIAVARFYIEQLTYTSIKQSPYIGPLNVLSSFGGLISVFFGFSFISLAEIIYYICIRPCRTSATRSNLKHKNLNGEVKSRIQLANRSKIHYVNPYKGSMNMPLKRASIQQY